MIYKAGFIVMYLCCVSAQQNKLFCQQGTIQGRIKDFKTSEPLPFAHVFINNTTIGSVADESGNYTLTNVPEGPHEIVFSFIGYTSFKKKLEIKSNQSIQLDVSLIPDNKELETVLVAGTRDKKWEKSLKKFEKIFLGTSKNSRSCKIVNPWVLEFDEASVDGKKAFTATASRPLEIENEALGYRILYHLKSFTSLADRFNITGEIQFEELAGPDQKQKTWSQNRNDTYLGSSKHFLHSMAMGNAKEAGFDIYTDKSGYENNPYRSAIFATQLDKSIQSTTPKIIHQPEGTEYSILIPKRLEVHYRFAASRLKVYNDILYPVSWIQVNGGVIRINKSGSVLNPSSVTLSGAMNEGRVADLLPNNFTTGTSPHTTPQPINAKQLKLNTLAEKTYLHTDKTYYYPGEKIWFKAYMNYKAQEKMDTLSKVLHVELISPESKIIQSEIIPVAGGSGFGSILLPSKSPTGVYYLRAYTEWMLNYPEPLFIKPIPIIGLYERPEEGSQIMASEVSEIILISEKLTYKPKERVTLEFKIIDEQENPVQADLSISVTDNNMLTDVPDEKNILQAFPFLPDGELPRMEIKSDHSIENSIPLMGQYLNKRGKPEKANLMVVEGNFKKTVPVTTDTYGNFRVSGFEFMDTTHFSFHLDTKKNFEGSIALIKRTIPAIEPLQKANLNFSIVPDKTIRHHVEIPMDNSRLLNQVIMKESTVEVSQEVPNTYSKADFSYQGDELIKSSRVSLASALIGRVPGLSMVDGILRLGGGSNFFNSATTEPLIIIDGVQITSGGTARLSQIMPEIVERIDVIKYGGTSVYGSRGGNGVIIVTTKGGEFAEVNTSIPNSNSFKVFSVQGFSKNKNFVGFTDGLKDRYESIDSGLTIFWLPKFLTDENTGVASVSFFTGDYPTNYKIVVEGVNTFGKPLRGVFYLDVKD
ncbi:MAG: carboxypeptidase-like regulatory domain-containing protein [Cyclobacteriaceae bacterium]|nr:carboxypeptidase-like regulatory domain-containing protein [Cyclobacteriaceae bacterium]